MSDLTMEEKIEKFKNNENFKFETVKELKNFLVAIKNEEPLLKKFKEEFISKLPLTYQRVLTMFCLKNMKKSDIAKIEEILPLQVTRRLNKTLNLINSIIEKDSILVVKNTKVEKLKQTKVINKMQNILAKYKGKINYDTELLPYLSEEHKEVFLKYMKNNNGIIGTQLSKSLNKSTYYIFETTTCIINKIEKIISKKEEIAYLYKKFGGESGLEDLKLFLDNNEKIYLEKYILNSSPNAFEETRDAINLPNAVNLIETMHSCLINKISNILERKQQVAEFIKKNGGEDFLLYDFGSTLSDEHFEVLVHVMMDYHYINRDEICKSLGKNVSFVRKTELSILKKLENYYDRKKEVDNLIEAAGGVDKVISEIYNNLSEIDKTIFMEFTLAYIKPQVVDFAKKIGIGVVSLYNVSNAQLQKLQDMAAANQKS